VWLSRLQLNIQVSAAEFRFTPPHGVEVVNQ
jgi:outer membrane lipoprotein-sorting protein